jgi:hypothetical protein
MYLDEMKTCELHIGTYLYFVYDMRSVVKGSLPITKSSERNGSHWPNFGAHVSE